MKLILCYIVIFFFIASCGNYKPIDEIEIISYRWTSKDFKKPRAFDTIFTSYYLSFNSKGLGSLRYVCLGNLPRTNYYIDMKYIDKNIVNHFGKMYDQINKDTLILNHYWGYSGHDNYLVIIFHKDTITKTAFTFGNYYSCPDSLLVRIDKSLCSNIPTYNFVSISDSLRLISKSISLINQVFNRKIRAIEPPTIIDTSNSNVILK